MLEILNVWRWVVFCFPESQDRFIFLLSLPIYWQLILLDFLVGMYIKMIPSAMKFGKEQLNVLAALY